MHRGLAAHTRGNFIIIGPTLCITRERIEWALGVFDEFDQRLVRDSIKGL